MRSILVADEDLRFCLATVALFEQLSSQDARGQGLLFHRATTVEEALTVLEHNPIELMVTGMKLSDADCLPLLLKAHRRFPAVPRVVLSPYGNGLGREACLNAGATLFLNKPGTRRSALNLYEILLTLLDAVDARQQSQQQRLAVLNARQAVHRLALEGASAYLKVRRDESHGAEAGKGEAGEIYVQAGAIVHSRCGFLEGASACRRLMAFERCRVQMHPYTNPPRISMKPGSWEYLHNEHIEGPAPHSEEPDRPHTPQSMGSGVWVALTEDCNDSAVRPIIGETHVPPPRASSARESDDCESAAPMDEVMDDAYRGPFDDLPESDSQSNDTAQHAASPSVPQPQPVATESEPHEPQLPEENAAQSWMDQMMVCSRDGSVLESHRMADAPSMASALSEVADQLSALHDELAPGELEQIELKGKSFDAVIHLDGELRGFAVCQNTAIHRQLISTALRQRLRQAGVAR